MAVKMVLAALAGFHAPHAEAAHLRNPQGLMMSAIPMHTYRNDCGLNHPVSLAAAKVSTRNPGAGMEPDSFTFDKVLKDSFYQVDCVADYMFTHGDKFGDAKKEYLLGDVSNVSIVHYTAHVVKEDREQMTHELCFSFCRTIPDMNFFGITNGRECYCMTYYKPMADDSSECDEVCDGNPGTMCGGKTKSSIFGMHTCDNTAELLTAAEGKMSEVNSEMVGLQKDVSDLSVGMQEKATAWQAMLGNAGDLGASDLAQTAKEFAGELEHMANAAGNLSETMNSLTESVTAMNGVDLTAAPQMKEAEGLLESMEEATTQGIAAMEELETLLAQASPNVTNQANASQQYYSIMYFVDKLYESVPSTCTGAAAEKPMVGTMDHCARACDADIHECVGFSYFPGTGADENTGLCFMMSKFKTVKYWAGCAASVDDVLLETGRGHLRKSLLQRHAAADSVDVSQVRCMVKFAEFEGDTLKPNPSGKCDICLEEATKADRCFA